MHRHDITDVRKRTHLRIPNNYWRGTTIEESNVSNAAREPTRLQWRANPYFSEFPVQCRSFPTQKQPESEYSHEGLRTVQEAKAIENKLRELPNNSLPLAAAGSRSRRFGTSS